MQALTLHFHLNVEELYYWHVKHDKLLQLITEFLLHIGTAKWRGKGA